jgi:hypothetical protein
MRRENWFLAKTAKVLRTQKSSSGQWQWVGNAIRAFVAKGFLAKTAKARRKQKSSNRQRFICEFVALHRKK